jgi:hypothetical protein
MQLKSEQVPLYSRYDLIKVVACTIFYYTIVSLACSIDIW